MGHLQRCNQLKEYNKLLSPNGINLIKSLVHYRTVELFDAH